MRRAALYLRVSSLDQHPETQRCDLVEMAAQRGYEIVAEYVDRISGAKARRPGLGDLLHDARRGRFDVVLVWASDRIARSVKHFLDILDEFNHLNIEFASFREQIDTGGPLGRAVVTIIGVVAELERNLIIERVRAGMRAPGSKAATSGVIRSNLTARPSSPIAAAASACARSPRLTALAGPLSTASSMRSPQPRAPREPRLHRHNHHPYIVHLRRHKRAPETRLLKPTKQTAEFPRFGRPKTNTSKNTQPHPYLALIHTFKETGGAEP
jgi:hypothetical protein